MREKIIFAKSDKMSANVLINVMGKYWIQSIPYNEEFVSNQMERRQTYVMSLTALSSELDEAGIIIWKSL